MKNWFIQGAIDAVTPTLVSETAITCKVIAFILHSYLIHGKTRPPSKDLQCIE